MSKRIHLNDEELYIIKQFVQDELNRSMIETHWVYQSITRNHLNQLMEKLESPERKKQVTDLPKNSPDTTPDSSNPPKRTPHV